MNDCVYRQAAIDALDGEVVVTGKTNAKAVKEYIQEVSDKLKAIPSAEVEPVKRGYWKTTMPGEPMFGVFTCSECGALCRNVHWNYCPCCGAKMLR